MAPGPNGMMPKGAAAGQMGGQPYIMAGDLTAGFPGVVSRSSWARGCSPEWAASARGR